MAKHHTTGRPRRTPHRRREQSEAGPLPVGVADVVEKDADGDLFVRPTNAGQAGGLIRLAPDRREDQAGAPGLGDRVLVRFVALESGEIEARLIKRLGQSAHRILGVVRKSARETRIEPVDRRTRTSLIIPHREAALLTDGDLVTAQVAGGDAHQPYGPKTGHVIETVGRADAPRAASLIAIHTHGLPTGFSEGALAEARAAGEAPPAKREDLTGLAFVTIDPADARDHDDAVFAQADDDPNNRGGWIAWVAIADVAAYVRPGSALDRAAWEKGNSAYFPDRVEPMLPERLSTDLCSLIEGQSRPCLAVRMVFDANGDKRSHRFLRGRLRSAASLSYEQVQAAAEGAPDAAVRPLADDLAALWLAYAILAKGRDRRSPLAIESPERKITLTDQGEVAAITPRITLEAHRLIEEFMIQANVCAAETLEARRTPLIYRVHEPPSDEKIRALADFLATLGLPWSKGEAPRTDRFNRLLDAVRGREHAEIVNEVVLRTQMQAHYAVENVGHFGLNLARYAHFTSPIRRYADLIVHRALISALGLGGDGLASADRARLSETADHITLAERRAMAAERDANDRYVALFLAGDIGAEFCGRITGVTRFGLFVRLADTGADGLVPISTLGGDYYHHEEATHCLVGERGGGMWRLGRTVEVRLKEATPLTGGLLFEMLSEPEAADPSQRRPRRRPAAPPRGRRRR